MAQRHVLGSWSGHSRRCCPAFFLFILLSHFLLLFIIAAKLAFIHLFLDLHQIGTQRRKLNWIPCSKQFCQILLVGRRSSCFDFLNDTVNLLTDGIYLLLELSVVLKLFCLLKVLYLCLHLPPQVGNAQSHVILDPAGSLPAHSHPLQILVVVMLRLLLALHARLLKHHHPLLLLLPQSLLVHAQRAFPHPTQRTQVLLVGSLSPTAYPPAWLEMIGWNLKCNFTNQVQWVSARLFINPSEHYNTIEN